MRYILSLLLLSITLFGADLAWPNDYKKALADAKAENKFVYILITSDSCRWCREFERTTLQDSAIQERLSKEFVTIHLSRDRDTIPKEFATAPVPRHYFVDANGETLYGSLGHRDVEMFDAFMDNAHERYKKYNGEK